MSILELKKYSYRSTVSSGGSLEMFVSDVAVLKLNVDEKRRVFNKYSFRNMEMIEDYYYEESLPGINELARKVFIQDV